MALSKKHFEQIASRFQLKVARINAETTDLTNAEKRIALGALNSLACDLCIDFQFENERFDSKRFLKACGF